MAQSTRVEGSKDLCELPLDGIVDNCRVHRRQSLDRPSTEMLYADGKGALYLTDGSGYTRRRRASSDGHGDGH